MLTAFVLTNTSWANIKVFINFSQKHFRLYRSNTLVQTRQGHNWKFNFRYGNWGRFLFSCSLLVYCVHQLLVKSNRLHRNYLCISSYFNFTYLYLLREELAQLANTTEVATSFSWQIWFLKTFNEEVESKIWKSQNMKQITYLKWNESS